MGLPNISIIFKSIANSIIKRSARGIVALIIRDDTENTFSKITYKSISDIDFTKISKRNYEYLKLVYKGAPSKVIVVNIGNSGTVNDALKILSVLKWNYLSMPCATEEETLTISAWIKEQRNNNKKTFKAVLANSRSDFEGIINFTTDNIKSSISDTVFSNYEYCARIVGLLAGLPLTRSSTYYVFDDIKECDLELEPDKKIDKGEFIIIYDGEDYKVGRGVNSLTTFTSEKSSDFSKIKIVEGIDLYTDDIRDTFEKYYVGKYRNDYDNKQAFVSAINAYNKTLEGDVLDSSFDNKTIIDVDAQKLFLESKGKDTSTLDETKIKLANTGSNVFVKSNIKFVDAMEDLTMINYL
ncbi:MAG: hypothetical protein KGV43_02465 [Arcobacter sp.]|nr:hypothetical protein [Arcobacter sp.]